MKRFFIGIDGGGTSSRLLACDVEGNVIGRSIGKSTNIESNPALVVKNNLEELVHAFLSTSACTMNDCLGICIGTAGVDTKKTLQEMERIIGLLSFPCPVHVTNDAEIALAAQTRGKPGILLISGTGSIGYAINEHGQNARVGGYGYLIGDEGSSYWLSRKAITAALRGYDGTGGETVLLPMILDALKLQYIEDVLDFVYQGNKSDIAALAPLVIKALQEGDLVARGIVEDASRHLAGMATALAHKLSMEQKPYPLVFAGGLFLNTAMMADRVYSIVRETYPNLVFTLLEQEAVAGAVYIAARRHNVTMKDILL